MTSLKLSSCMGDHIDSVCGSIAAEIGAKLSIRINYFTNFAAGD